MHAERALADLVEISPQLEAVAVLAGGGELVGSLGVSEARAGVLARAVGELLAAARRVRRDEAEVTQLHASLRDGDVFAVRGSEGRTIVALARGKPAPGLVFYDLKRCLAAVAEDDTPQPSAPEASEAQASKPARRRRKKEADAET